MWRGKSHAVTRDPLDRMTSVGVYKRVKILHCDCNNLILCYEFKQNKNFNHLIFEVSIILRGWIDGA